MQMSRRITFQFEDDLDYQMKAIHSTMELFRGLSRHVMEFINIADSLLR